VNLGDSDHVIAKSFTFNDQLRTRAQLINGPLRTHLRASLFGTQEENRNQ
jgi:hypothetical protein